MRPGARRRRARLSAQLKGYGPICASWGSLSLAIWRAHLQRAQAMGIREGGVAWRPFLSHCSCGCKIADAKLMLFTRSRKRVRVKNAEGHTWGHTWGPEVVTASDVSSNADPHWAIASAAFEPGLLTYSLYSGYSAHSAYRLCLL